MTPLGAISAVGSEVKAEAYRAGHADGDHRSCDKDACPVWVAHWAAYPEDRAALDRWTAS